MILLVGFRSYERERTFYELLHKSLERRHRKQGCLEAALGSMIPAEGNNAELLQE